MTPPLAERLRPATLDDLFGQEHLTGKGSILRTAIENGKIPSMILWGPPGVGKTTIAISSPIALGCLFIPGSGDSSGVKDVVGGDEGAKSSRPLASCFSRNVTVEQGQRILAGRQKSLPLHRARSRSLAAMRCSV